MMSGQAVFDEQEIRPESNLQLISPSRRLRTHNREQALGPCPPFRFGNNRSAELDMIGRAEKYHQIVQALDPKLCGK